MRTWNERVYKADWSVGGWKIRRGKDGWEIVDEGGQAISFPSLQEAIAFATENPIE